MSLLVVGSIALDTVETPFGRRSEALGGSATYFSCAAQPFSQVHIVGVVGEDFPQEYLDLLVERNIDVSGIEISPGRTFRWSGRYGYDLNERETLSTQLNVFEKFHPKLPDHTKSLPHLFLANIDPELQLEVLEQMTDLRFVACDTMNLWIDLKHDAVVKLIEKVDAIILNDSEARQLTGEPNLVKAARKVQEMGCEMVVVKKGEHGCLLCYNDQHFAAPAYPLETVFDPTGAGDSFAGGFMGHLARVGTRDDSALRQAIIFGSVMASFSVEEFSLDRLQTATEDEILERFDEFKTMTHFDAVD